MYRIATQRIRRANPGARTVGTGAAAGSVLTAEVWRSIRALSRASLTGPSASGLVRGEVIEMKRSLSRAALAAACVLFFGAAPAEPQSSPALSGLDALYPEMQKLYVDLHQTPELSLHE